MPSTKLLRPVQPGDHDHEMLCCSVCDSRAIGPQAARERWYRNHEETGEFPDFFCPRHALLEDFDPDWPANQAALQGVPVSRKMPLQGITDPADLFFDLVVVPGPDSLRQDFQNRCWISLPVCHGYNLYHYAKLSDAVKGVAETMVSPALYVDISQRPNGELLVSLKYQQQLGSRFVCILPSIRCLDSFFTKK